MNLHAFAMLKIGADQMELIWCSQKDENTNDEGFYNKYKRGSRICGVPSHARPN